MQPTHTGFGFGFGLKRPKNRVFTPSPSSDTADCDDASEEAFDEELDEDDEEEESPN